MLLETEHGVGPYNIKAIGEGPTTPVASAIANAVFDACGVRIRDLPLTSEKVYAPCTDEGVAHWRASLERRG